MSAVARVILAIGLLLALGLAGVAPAAARSTKLYPQKVDLHFADAKGKVRTLALEIYVPGASLGDCTEVGEDGARAIVAEKKPELHALAYLGSTCHGAKPPSAASAVQPVDDDPAILVLFYLTEDGKNKYATFGAKKAGEYTTLSCPLALKKQLSALRKQAESTTHAGQEFRGAYCFQRNRSNLNAFPNS